MGEPQTPAEATEVIKREITMPDGRYMTFYTFPNIEKDIPSSSDQQKATPKKAKK